MIIVFGVVMTTVIIIIIIIIIIITAFNHLLAEETEEKNVSISKTLVTSEIRRRPEWRVNGSTG